MSAMARGNSFLYSSDLFIPHFLTSVLIQVLEHLLSLGSDIHHHCSVFFVVSSIAVVPNLFGIRDWYRGRQFLHGLGQEGWFQDDSDVLHLLCTLFLLLLYQLHHRSSGIRYWRLGDPMAYRTLFSNALGSGAGKAYRNQPPYFLNKKRLGK